MLLPISWLKNYIDLDKSTKEIADEVTLTGSHVESIINRAEGISGVVVGKILKITNHPDADKLVICQVDVGDEVLQIVTGAKNVFEGALVPVSKVGANLAGGIKIKKGKLRGVESDGMLCSLEELGYEISVIPKEARDGIFIFREDYKLGTDVKEILDLNNPVIEFEITPNRPDCLSIIGMAREVAATFDTKLKNEEIKIENPVDNIKNYFNGVEVKTEKCQRFYGRVLKDVKIEESPLWLKNYLMASGVRPINNIVDLTNFVMLEYGQPLHAYNLETLEDKKIIVRQAEDGEVIKTLDDVERKLNKDDIVICDGKRIVGIAGLMGGFDTEITPQTKIVFLEGANFNEKSVRLTSKRQGLRTEASARFEKGIDSNLAKVAVDRVCQLSEKISCAKVVDSAFDEGQKDKKEKKIKLRLSKTNKLIGEDLSLEEISKILNRLEIETELFDEYLIAKVPSFRLDIGIEEDLIEEVARIYGYHNIEPKPLFGGLTVGSKPKFRNVEKRVKDILMAYGYSEFMTYSFVSPSIFNKLNLKEDNELRKVVKIINPLGEEYSIMRTTLVANMLEVLSKNYNRNNERAAGFEFGNTFTPSDKLPEERLKLTIGSYNQGDFYNMKEMILKALWTLGIDDLKVKPSSVEYLHPGRSADLYKDDIYLGSFGEVHPSVLEKYSIKTGALVGEFEFNKFVELSKENRLYKELPKYPSMKRDFAFILDRDVSSEEIEEVAKKYGKKILEDFNVFDIYTGKGIEEGKKSIAFSLIFRANDRTLTDSEVEKISDKIIQEIKDNFKAKLRGE